MTGQSLMLDMTSGVAHTPPAPRPLDTHDWKTCPCEAHAVSRRIGFMAYRRAVEGPVRHSIEHAEVIAQEAYDEALRGFRAAIEFDLS